MSTPSRWRSEEHTSELQSQFHLVCRLLLEKKNDDVRVRDYDERHGADDMMLATRPVAVKPHLVVARSGRRVELSSFRVARDVYPILMVIGGDYVRRDHDLVWIRGATIDGSIEPRANRAPSLYRIRLDRQLRPIGACCKLFF